MDFFNSEQKKNVEYAVGLDLTDSFSQISIGEVDSDTVETLASNAATGYMIPTALFKRSEVNQWFAGNEAIKYKDSEGVFIDRLVTRASNDEEVEVAGEKIKISALLALFMKRVLAMVNIVTPLNNIASLMITVDVLNHEMVKVLSEAIASMGLKTKNIFFESHMESFFYFLLYQPKDLWNKDVLLVDANGEYLKSMRLECNKNTTPVVAFIDSLESDVFKCKDADVKLPGDALISFSEESLKGRAASSIYLIGDIFKGAWCQDAINSLCRKGRVFQGNNLFSKGACYGAKNKINPTMMSSGYVFLGNDKLKSNIGMNVSRRGENSYLAILDGGVNWFDAKKECDFILNQGNRVSFVITPLTGKNPKLVDITLENLPKRPPKTTRLHLSVKMQSESKMKVTIKDLGFGELFPGSEIEWNEVISV